MIYTVMEVTDKAIVVWDGKTYIDKSNVSGRDESTLTLPVGNPSRFQVNDKVSLIVMLDERPEQKVSNDE
jgi:dTDP-glucose pyrophosphorylase